MTIASRRCCPVRSSWPPSSSRPHSWPVASSGPNEPFKGSADARYLRPVSLPPEIIAAMTELLSSPDHVADLALLATQMKPEGAFRDAVFVALRRRGVSCAIEARSAASVHRTDLVFSGDDGQLHAVEFKMWVAPDLSKPAKILKAARDDSQKHNGHTIIATVISRVRSEKYFVRPVCRPLWELDYPRGMIAKHLGVDDEWLHVSDEFFVSLVGSSCGASGNA